MKQLEKFFDIGRAPCGRVNWNVLWFKYFYYWFVAPLVGAWIETRNLFGSLTVCRRRAPCGRVNWNRLLLIFPKNQKKSRPLWARELKPVFDNLDTITKGRAPCGRVNWNLLVSLLTPLIGSRAPCGRVNWNMQLTIHRVVVLLSRPLWARELKPLFLLLRDRDYQSRPLWARELKHQEALVFCMQVSRAPCGRVNWNIFLILSTFFSQVAPLVGAWIETCAHRLIRRKINSRAPCGRVNWNYKWM